MKRLLGIFAHPDDECYSAGGVFATGARCGVDVTVVSLTRGENGTSSVLTENLAQLRSDEMAASCHVLGINPPVILDLPDGHLGDLGVQELGAVIGNLVLRMRPDVVLTLGRDGAYGHRDHIATTEAIDLAVGALAITERPGVVHAEFPRGLFRPVWKMLRRVQGIIEPRIDGQAIGIEDSAADFKVTVSDFREVKLAALACYRSQLPDSDPLAFLRPGLISGLLDEEWFTVASEAGVPGSDLFAGLV